MIPYSNFLVLDLLEEALEVARFLYLADFLQELLVQAQLLSRHFLTPFAPVGALLLNNSVLLGRFLHEVLSVLPSLDYLLLLALFPLLVFSDRVLELSTIEIGLILLQLLVLLFLGHSLLV